jgi:triacylglycerol esterase/lipase EstA (alpha/beta hydrolase family)
MIDTQAGLVLLSALVFAAITTALCVADGKSWPMALLAGGAAAGSAIGVLALLL